jgi:hypothetical protein
MKSSNKATDQQKISAEDHEQIAPIAQISKLMQPYHTFNTFMDTACCTQTQTQHRTTQRHTQQQI